MGKDLLDILRPLGLSLDQFSKICDEFTNKKLFKCNKDGNLLKDNLGNLTKINDDNL